MVRRTGPCGAQLLHSSASRWLCVALVAAAMSLCDASFTPCTQYNSMHSRGEANCWECTGLYFNEAELKKPDYIMVMNRDGSFYPMVRPFIPLLKKPDGDSKIKSCMWCPETQQCGHPDDWRVKCPSMRSSFSRAAADSLRPDPDAEEPPAEQPAGGGEEKPPAPAKMDQAALKLKTGGWITRKDCVDNPINTRERYDEELDAFSKELSSLSSAKRDEQLRNEAIRSAHSVETRVRETTFVHESDSVYDCFGDCVLNGPSHCSLETKKQMRSSEEPEDSKTVILKPSENPVACSFTVEKGSGSQGFKAAGQYSRRSDYWLSCQLMPCTILPPDTSPQVPEQQIE